MTVLAGVKGSFNYVGAMDGEPLYFKHQPDRTNLNYDPRTVEVHDIRRFAQAPTLEREGFSLAHLPLVIGDERDPEAIDAVYHPAFHRLIGEITGAPKVVVKRSMLRSSERATDDARLEEQDGLSDFAFDLSDVFIFRKHAGEIAHPEIHH